jgi:hypothetical protein
MANLQSRQVAKRAKVNGVTKRPKAKKKSKPVCPVVAALNGQALDIRRYNALCQEWGETPAGDKKERLADQCRAVRDVISGRWEAISHLHPQSLTGAIYMLMVGFADFDDAPTIADAGFRDRQRRRARRCLRKGIDRLRHLPMAHEDYRIGRWLMPFDETEWSHLFYGRVRADELIEQARKAGAS